MNEIYSCYLVINEKLQSVLGILKVKQAFEEHSHKRGGLQNEDGDQHHWVFTLLSGEDEGGRDGHRHFDMASMEIHSKYVGLNERTFSADSDSRSSLQTLQPVSNVQEFGM